MQLAKLSEGDKILDFVGPLGVASHFDDVKKVERKHSQDFLGVFKKGKEKLKNITHRNASELNENEANVLRKEAEMQANKLEEEARKEAEKQQLLAEKVRKEAATRLLFS